MSTQHPDNVSQPFFVEDTLIGGEDEVQEAFYAFSHLGCDEQMWDFEGKEVDNSVVKKLLTNNEAFFKANKLGEDIFLTYRVPNPDVERAESKILLETLESIPRGYDAAKLFYGAEIAPVFEVIMPMATSAPAIDRIYRYYKDFVAGKQHKKLNEKGITIGEWIGDFKPEKVNVIPLFENKKHMLGSADILREYLEDKKLEYQRVFLARSDPALNYGQIGAVLILKTALQRLHALSKELKIPIYPILGAGSAPFRGNLRPQSVERLLHGYPSVHTYTIQSSFKFDNPPEVVFEAIKKISNHSAGIPIKVDEDKSLDIFDRYSKEYCRQLKKIAPMINEVAQYVPSRRKRKLHIGLFGYSRSMDGVSLPRAIKFTSALYSIGVPPELLGFNALTKKDLDYLKKIYPTIKEDLSDAFQHVNFDSPYLPAEALASVKEFLPSVEISKKHKQITDQILELIKGERTRESAGLILEAASVRGFLG
jgi:phosphoenolpyruvate carboxylase